MAPQRFILTNAQVAEGFAAAGCSPPHTEFYAGLPAASSQLPDLLEDEDGQLHAAARTVFETLTSPVLMLRFLNLAPGSALAVETRVLGGASGQFVVLARPDADFWDLALLPERAVALALLDELIGASRLEEPGEEFSLSVSLPALAVLACMAQLVRLGELRAALNEDAAQPEFLFAPIPTQYVESVLETERDKPDLRSPVSLLGLASEGALFDALDAGGLPEALADLVKAGLVDDECILTGDGLALVALLKSRESLSLLQSARREGAKLTVDALLLFHARASLLAGAWRLGEDGRASGLNLTGMGGAELLGLLDRMLSLPDLPAAAGRQKGGFCPECGAAHESTQKFCRECGCGLSARAAAT